MSSMAPPRNDATLELTDRAGWPVAFDAALRVTPTVWSAHAMGGPERATVEVTGPADLLWAGLRWLGHRARIRNGDGALCWWGYVHAVEVVQGGVAIGLSLDDLANSIRVLYAYDDTHGENVDGETAPATDSASQDAYGLREVLHSGGTLDPAAALQLRDRILAARGWPAATAQPQGDAAPVATLSLRGDWERTGWQYYADADGRIVFETGDSTQRMGWLRTGTDIGFAPGPSAVYAKGAALGLLRAGDRLTVSGSAAGNSVRFTLTGEGQNKEPASYTATTISFEANDDIKDSAGGLGDFRTDDVIEVTGASVGNSGYHLLDSGSAKALTTDLSMGGVIGADVAGPTITIEQLGKADIEPKPYLEVPGASITLTLDGAAMAQKFTPAAAWTLDEALFLVSKEGAPSDTLVARLYSDNPGTGPDTMIAQSAAVNGTAVSTKQRWETFTFATPVALTAGTVYWIELQRTGAGDPAHHYLIGVDEEMGDSGGALKVWTGTLWTEREPNADMAYQLWGKRETTTQAAAMLAACTWVSGVQVETASGLRTRHYRDGRQTVRDEVEALLALGTSGGAGLWARVSAERSVVIAGEASADAASDLLVDGQALYTADGRTLGAGLVPAGRWAWLRGLPPAAQLKPLAPLFLERVEYDARRGTWSWEPRGSVDPIADWTLRNA